MLANLLQFVGLGIIFYYLLQGVEIENVGDDHDTEVEERQGVKVENAVDEDDNKVEEK